MRQAVGIKTEPGDMLKSVADTHRVQQANGHEVSRTAQGLPEPGRAIRPATVIFRAPLVLKPGVVKHDGGIVDNTCCSKAMFQRRRVDKWFETGPRLAPRLGNTVELAAVKIEAADQGQQRAVMRVQ